jgi:thiol-disulfide isomerase/thioredoxin
MLGLSAGEFTGILRVESMMTTRNPLLRFALASLFAAVLTAPVVSAAPPQQSAADGNGEPNIIRFVKNPEAAPLIEGRDLNGAMVSSKDWKGKITILSFWATWCGPCRREIPEFQTIQREYPDAVQIIGVSIDEGPPEQVKRFAAEHGITYPIIMATPQIVSDYGGIPALPSTFVLNQAAAVVTKHVGLYSASVFDQEIRALLGLVVDAKIVTFEDHGEVFLKNASNATELPGLDLTKLDPKEKQAVLKHLNSEDCTCGCAYTLAQCRILDPTCPTSLHIARSVVDLATGKHAPPPAAKSSTAKSPAAN